jgi:RNA polymerase sigma factor FliA
MEEVLWQNWLANRQQKDLWPLVEFYTEFNRDVARYMHSQLYFTGVDLDDFIQTGLLGLVDAIKAYDSSLGASFNHYARFRIRGAILNSLPKTSEQQSINAYYKRLEYERNKSIKSGNKLAGVEDLANLVIQLSYSYLLDEINEKTDDSDSDKPYQLQHMKELKSRLHNSVDKLPEQERQVIKFHYFSHDSFESIGQYLQLSKGRISQIHKKAILKLQSLVHENYKKIM